MSEMSTKEINEIIGMTLERLKQAHKELACLNVKAENMSKNIETVGKVLRGEIPGDCTSGFFLIDVPEGKRRIDWPTVQNMNDVLIKRERLTTEITDLEEKVRQMGHG